MVEYLRDGDSVGVWNLREEFVECVGQLEFPFLDELKDQPTTIPFSSHTTTGCLSSYFWTAK
jgi:hypothetical protein